MSRFILISIAAVAALSACASVENSSEPRDEKQLVTGSNIPRRDRSDPAVTVLPKEALESFQRSSGVAQPPKN